MRINYNPITPKNFAPLLRSTAELGTHRIICRGGRYSGKTTTVIQDALEGFISIPGANIVITRVDDCDFRISTHTSLAGRNRKKNDDSNDDENFNSHAPCGAQRNMHLQ